MMLPSAERRSRTEEVLALLAGRWEGWAIRARRRWRRHARAHWLAERPVRSPWLSGSLLALRRSAWERVGPFDEGFRLFFEETDWLLRAWRLGLPVWYVPAAEAVHLYNQSASREPRAQQWFEESAQRFRRKHYGIWFAKLLTALDRWLPRRARRSTAGPESLGREIEIASPAWVEVSPNATGYPAAAERVMGGSRWSLPAEIAERLPSGPLWVVVSDEQGEEVGG
jgi:GT2 family glycosyltransferase